MLKMTFREFFTQTKTRYLKLTKGGNEMTKKEVFELELLAKGFFEAIVDMYRTAETEAQKHQLIDILFVYRTWFPAELFESKVDEKICEFIDAHEYIGRG